jgi:hypothetical protein
LIQKHISFINNKSFVFKKERIDTNGNAYFLAGVILEKLSLPLTAINYYQMAIEISNDDADEITILARRGYARLLW